MWLFSWGTGSSLTFSSANPISLLQKSLLPLLLSQQIKLLGFHQSFFPLAVLSLLPLPGPFPRSGSLVHCVLKQPMCMYRKGAPKQGSPSLTRNGFEETESYWEKKSKRRTYVKDIYFFILWLITTSRCYFSSFSMYLHVWIWTLIYSECQIPASLNIGACQNRKATD